MTTRRCLSLVWLACSVGAPLFAQSPPAADPRPAADPPLRRWFEIQQFTLATRYRYVMNNKDVTTSNQEQYKDSFRARINLDPQKRYTVNIGYFTGGSFISSWNNLGIGNSTLFVGKDHYLKQLYASAAPVKGLEFQYGGLYVSRGESDDWVGYDDDNYMVGERATVRRPKELFLDELTVTRGVMGPLTTPDVTSRWDGLKHQDYTQLLGVKRLNKTVSGSFEYDRQVGADILRAAVTLHFSASAPVNTVRYEQYRRLNQNAAAGFSVWADRAITKYLRAQGGYLSVDQFYGGWNADKALSGRRFFLNTNFPIYGPLTGSFYVTQALDAPYAVPLKRRVDAYLTYDVLNTLRRTGIF